MMPKHFLTCDCGLQTAIEPRQAGETLRCECGRPLSVPALRELRQLPVVVADQQPAETAAAWGIRHGAMTVLVLAAIVSLAAAGLSWWNQPSLPKFDPADWTQHMDSRISELTPVTAWKVWVDTYQPLAAAGFAAMEFQGAAAIEQEIDRRQWMELILATVGAVCLIAAVMTALVGRSSARAN